MEEMTPIPQTKKKLWLIPLGCVLLAAAAVAAFFLTENSRQYQKAQQLQAQEAYQEAAMAFDALGGYRDAAQQAERIRYQWAGVLREEGRYAEALEVYEVLGAYLNSQEHVRECCYELGLAALEAQALDEAIDWFTRATDEYKDAGELRLKSVYQRGHDLLFVSMK